MPPPADLATQYLPMALSLASRAARRQPWLADEFRGEAQLALVEAAADHDPDLLPFPAYARLRIVGAIKTVLRRDHPLGYRESADRDDAPSAGAIRPGAEPAAKARPVGADVDDADELEAWLRKAPHKALLVAIYVDGLSVERAAAACEIPSRTAHHRHAAALSKLRKSAKFV